MKRASPGSSSWHPTSLKESVQLKDCEECNKWLSTLEWEQIAKWTLRPIVSVVRVMITVDDGDSDKDDHVITYVINYGEHHTPPPLDVELFESGAVCLSLQ